MQYYKSVNICTVIHDKIKGLLISKAISFCDFCELKVNTSLIPIGHSLVY